MARWVPERGAWLNGILMSSGVVGVVRAKTAQVHAAYLGSVPERSGDLKKSIKQEVVPDPIGGGDRMAGFVYATEPQAFYLEYGTKDFPARHYLERAMGAAL